ncbi:tyrosinase-like protein tyr-3 [Mizuhopecten yessoensis]|uniref:Tyrosinase-like protein tyr-3 n=1 Tax=Mizuhopecten yessoensis TaxID=6573 RepID=A0A210QCD2_MIZYE|nr:tyrosinase-like protein tyr-3 [Mizuhopecten yessoensis]
MADTGITVALIAVMIQIISASKLMNVDSHQLADKEGQASQLNYIQAISKVLKARDTKKNDLNTDCTDDHIYCDRWAAIGECFNNPIYMQTNCRYSCGICCANNNAQCGYWAATGECYINPDYMLVNCRLSCGECCADNHNRCEYWAATGECFEQIDFMMENCAMSCGQCPGGGLYDGRDVTRDLDSSLPGTRDDSREQLGTDDKLKRAKAHWEPRTSTSSKGHNGPPGTRDAGSK